MSPRNLLFIPALLLAGTAFAQTPGQSGQPGQSSGGDMSGMPGMSGGSKTMSQMSGMTAPKAAHANIMDTTGKKIGTATITPADEGGVRIQLDVTGLPAGTHGVHIHNVGKCEGPAFTTAGPHFNPTDKKHGKDNPEGMHAGDMLNFDVGADGHGRAALMDPAVTLGDGANSLFHEGGTSLVIHASPDDYKTDPSGNSGARIACGVIEK